MDNQPRKRRFQLNAGSGMALGVIVAAVIALVASFTTGDNSIWLWAIPVGLAVGLAIGAGAARRPNN